MLLTDADIEATFLVVRVPNITVPADRTLPVGFPVRIGDKEYGLVEVRPVADNGHLVDLWLEQRTAA
jgi:hypothetical protein